MNFLAHLFLSGSSEEIIVGNFIGDNVKGKVLGGYPPLVKKGILLHRKIDAFTDNHNIFRQSKKLFEQRYHKYAGVVMDIIYDHLLSQNWDHFCTKPLDLFIHDIHNILMRNQDIFNEGVKQFFPSFIENNWLKIYGTIEGLERVLRGMAKRTSLPDEWEFASQRFQSNYDFFNDGFIQFFDDIVNFIETKNNIQIPDCKKNRVL